MSSLRQVQGPGKDPLMFWVCWLAGVDSLIAKKIKRAVAGQTINKWLRPKIVGYAGTCKYHQWFTAAYFEVVHFVSIRCHVFIYKMLR